MLSQVRTGHGCGCRASCVVSDSGEVGVKTTDARVSCSVDKFSSVVDFMICVKKRYYFKTTAGWFHLVPTAVKGAMSYICKCRQSNAN